MLCVIKSWNFNSAHVDNVLFITFKCIENKFILNLMDDLKSRLGPNSEKKEQFY